LNARRGWLLATLSTAFLVAVLASADRYADGDMGHLIAVEIRLSELLRSGDLRTALGLWWALIAPQPPIGYLPGVVAFTTLGVHPVVAPLTMGLALLACWDALSRLWAERAWLAWLPLLASPLVWIGVEQHGRDLLAGTALLQALSWLHQAQGFTSRRASVAFGAWLGLGFMTKYTFPIFAVLPCILAGAGLLRRPRVDRWKNLGLAVLSFLGVAGAWYAEKGGAVLGYVGFSFGEDMAANTANYRDVRSLSSLMYYPLALRDAQSLPGLFFVLGAAALGLYSAESRSRASSSLAAAVGGLGVLSTVPEAIDRYALPAFFALVSLLPALPAPTGWRRWLPLPLLVVTVPFGIATTYRFLPGSPTAPSSYEHPVSSLYTLAWPGPSTYWPSDLDPDAWHLPEAVAAIRAAQGRDDGTIGILAGRSPAPMPGFATVLIEGARQGFAWDFATVNTAPGRGAPEVFVGPLFDGERPSGEFSTLYVVRLRNPDSAIDRWLNDHPGEMRATFPGPDGATTAVYRLRAPFKGGGPR
jgi:hypothetical protein